ncbi:MAG: DUF1833 domain-containing protein [Alphaproteobacteria bacterium]|nr:DUF1833 domain-containing protein [Alphaproteobacteria bacterium]
MPRTIPEPLLKAMAGRESDEAFICLLTIDHSSLVSPLLFSADNQDTVSRGDTYISFSFNIVLPNNEDGKAPVMNLTIDNVDDEILQTLRQLDKTSLPTVMLEVVGASDPDTVALSLPDFTLRDVGYDAFTITGSMTLEDLVTAPYPADEFNVANFPGLY